MYKWESYLFLCHEFWPEAARAKTLTQPRPWRLLSCNTFLILKNSIILVTVGLSPLVKEITSAWSVSP